MEEKRPEIQYQCSNCPQIFDDTFDLKEHMYDQHGELIFDYECGCFVINEPDMPEEQHFPYPLKDKEEENQEEKDEKEAKDKEQSNTTEEDSEAHSNASIDAEPIQSEEQ